MSELRILHISDLHFKSCDPYDRDVVLKAFIDSLTHLKKQAGKPDLIAVSGDIAFSGKEYGKHITDFFNELLAATGLGKERLFVVPGNHDVDKDTGKWLCRSLASEEESVEYFGLDSPADHFNKFMAFNLWYNEYFQGIRAIEPKSTCQPPEIIQINDITVGVMLINSALFSLPDGKDEHQMWIGRRCLAATMDNLEKSPVDLGIALMHHPPLWLSDAEQANIKAMLKDNCDILLHGHLHSQDAEVVADYNGKILQVTAGACYQTREYPNKAVFLRVDCEAGKAYLLPVQYTDSPRPVWAVDTSLYPDQPNFEGGFDLKTQKLDGRKTSSGRAEKSEAWLKTNEPSIDSSALRKAYLDRLFETTGQVALSGIDPNIPEDAKSYLQLNAVYIALLTQTLEQELGEMKSGKTDQERKLLSALEQLERYDRLVLMGDPGGGKSTFVNFAALCLAGEGLGNPAVNLKTLKVPLPDDKGNPGEKEQSWTHGPLLPVRVILRDFAARGLPGNGESGCASHLWNFIAGELKECCIGDYAGHLKKELLEQGGLLLLDGLDEVPEADNRRGQIKDIIIEFAKTFKKCRILVTSRTYAYQKQDWKLPGFTEAILAPFSSGQIRQFVDRWYAHSAELRGINREDAKGRAELLKQRIFSGERIRVLAERPLLLTLMASLNAWRGGELPNKREQLYADATELLLETWQKAKTVRDSEGKTVIIQPSLIEWLKVDSGEMRGLLDELAYEAHSKQPDLTGTADIAQRDLLDKIMTLTRTNSAVNLVLLVEFLSWRAGLLISRGNGVYTFPHRTFQEYLASCYLAKKDYPDLLAGLVRKEPNRWREVALLTGAKAAEMPYALWGLVEVLLSEPSPDEDTLAGYWGALIAGQLIAESVIIKDLRPVYRAKLERVQQQMLKIIEQGKLPAVERAAAGRVLGKIGDPRKTVMTLNSMEFCLVPNGEFWLGDETYNLDYDYWISRYPVTVAQYAEFINDGGYQDAVYWNEAKMAGVWQNGKVRGLWDENIRDRPENVLEPFNFPNHPAVCITWYEALAFTRWLTQVWQRDGLIGKEEIIMLPNEPEWEKAARSGAEILATPVIRQLLQRRDIKLDWIDNPNPKRKYPWGGNDQFDPELANGRETVISGTNTPGCFPGGKSLYGLEELSGNVWEWTRTLYKEYPYDCEDGRETEDSKDYRVLRGGSWLDGGGYLHSSLRNGNDPGNSHVNIGFRIVIVERNQ